MQGYGIYYGVSTADADLIAVYKDKQDAEKGMLFLQNLNAFRKFSYDMFYIDDVEIDPDYEQLKKIWEILR